MGRARYFESTLTAGRYRDARPDVHGVALSNFAAFARLSIPVGPALDVGCGTGGSSAAIAGMARQVVGLDPSRSMLAASVEDPRVGYVCAEAEALPFGSEIFDLVVAAQAFHWFDQDTFLDEARRVLAPGGWLLVYNSGFTGEMAENPAFLDWFRGDYLTRYPTPPRGGRAVTEDQAARHGLAWRGTEEFLIDVPMSASRFTDYQLSTTNVAAAVGDDTERFEAARRWIRDSVAHAFGDEGERTFLFRGRNWYLQREASA